MGDNPVNETLKVIHRRHSVRQFQDRPVDDALIKVILDAANRAPSAHNQQSWKFIVIKGEKKQQLSQLVSDRSLEFPKPSSSILRMAARSIAHAPVVIAVVNTGTLINHGTELFKIEKDQARDFFRTMEIQSSAAAAENLLIATTSLGLGSVWLGILFLIKDEILSFFGESKGEFMAVIPVGYPLKEGEGPKKKSLEYVVKYLPMVMAAFMAVSGCDYMKKADEKYEGRSETVNVQALDAVGYNGTAIRKNVDKVLNQNDERNKQIEGVIGK